MKQIKKVFTVILALSMCLMMATGMTLRAANVVVVEQDFSESIEEDFNWKTNGGGVYIKDGVFSSNVKELYGLNYQQKLGATGVNKIEFDIQAKSDVVGEVMTMFVGLRMDKTTNNATGQGLWISFKNNTIGLRTGAFPTVTVMEIPYDFNDFRRVYIEDNVDEDVISIYTDNERGQKTLLAVIEIDGRTVKMYDAGEELVVTDTKDFDLPKNGYICWWAHHCPEQKIANIRIEYEEYVRPEYVPADKLAYRDTMKDTWVATDDLGRVTPTYEEVGAPNNTKVGMFYYLWLNTKGATIFDHYAAYLEGGVEGVNQQLQVDSAGNQSPQWWGKPYFGYYQVFDEWIIRKHATMLSNAGVDFIFYDQTNNVTFTSEYMKIFEVYRQMRQEGLATPQIVFFMGDDYASNFGNFWENVYKDGYYNDLWFMWDGKPLIMSKSGKVPADFEDQFTVRRSWAFNRDVTDGINQWQWCAEYPQKPGIDEVTGEVEHVSVSAGLHPVSTTMDVSVGRSFHNGAAETDGLLDYEFGLMETTKKGLTYEEQWSRAHELKPEVVTITSWNEWIAGKQDNGYMPGSWFCNTYRVTHDESETRIFFVDQFNPEFSRDVEPMAGGFGDNYYYQTIQNIRKIKGVRPIPEAAGMKTIDINGEISQWDSVWPEYRDTVHDTTHRNYPGYGDSPDNVNETGRNDIDTAKVSYDDEYYYFYVKTVDPITQPEGSNWMNLYVDIDQDHSTGWAGYDFIINRMQKQGFVSVEKNTGGYQWSNVGKASYVLNGNTLQIAVPRKLMEIDLNKGFDFKWADNSTTAGDPMQFMDLGDAGPDDRFNFRFTQKPAEINLSSPTAENIGGGVAMIVNRNQAVVENKLTKVDSDNTNVTPFVHEGRTVVPVRFLAESLGAKVSWNEEKQEVSIEKGSDTVNLAIGSKQIEVNGVVSELDVPAMTAYDRTFLPLRAIAEALGQKVSWDDRGIIVIGQQEAAQATMDELWLNV